MIKFITPYTFTTLDYRRYNANAILYTFQFTVTHALGFWVFTSRILAMDISQSHCKCKSHMKSLRSLIPLLPLFCSNQFRRLNSTTLEYCSLLLNQKSKSKSHCDWRSVSQQVLVAIPIWSPWSDIYSVWQLRSCFRGTPSLTRGRVCLLYVRWPLPAHSFSGPSPLGLATVFYCLRFETSFFVAFLRLAGSRWWY
jgi:hypothetical protein